MKKVLFLLFSALFVFSGCDIYTTEIVKPGVDIYTEYITVSPDEWVKNTKREGEAGCYLYKTVPCKNIDRNVLDNGAVMAYMIDDKEGDNPLPYVFPVETKRSIILQNIRFNVKKGYITFVVEWDDSEIYELDYKIQFKVCVFVPEKG